MDTTTVRIKRNLMKRVRIIAARRGVQPGILINKILSSRAAIDAALSVIDEKEREKLLKREMKNAESKDDTGVIR